MKHGLDAMKFWMAMLAGGLMAVAAHAGEAIGGRFSQTLSATELTDAGLDRLSSDQIAVIDALVRRDLAGQSHSPRGDEAPTPRFTQRLTEDERRTAGLTVLTEREVSRLDALVGHHTAAVVARTLLSPAGFIAPGVARLNADGVKTAPEIHGSFFLSYSSIKGGYSEKTGGMTLRFEDPSHRYAIQVGVSETRSNSPYANRESSDFMPYSP